ncbi:MAG: 50S ribosomal protein L4 [Bacteroidetes bacterium]|nr:50S ribosomal protein L4 [Bacteroidota bacterium]
MKVDVLNKNGQPAGRQIELPDDIFGIEPNDHVVYLAVKQQRAGERSGTHKAKERGEIKGSTKKIKKQKGTGTARAGSIKSPIFRGGGRIFGPRPRSYDFKLNKKVVSLAQRSALSSMLASGDLKVVEDFDFDAPKTKSYLDVLKSFDLTGKKSLLVVPELTGNLYLSSRNVSKTKVTPAGDLSVYDILDANTVLLSEKAVEAIKEQFSKN